MKRKKISQKRIKKAIEEVINRIERKNEKGNGYGYGWLSNHEIYGKLSEEFHELLIEMHLNKTNLFRDELIDVAVAAIWGIVSIDDYENK